MVTDLKKDKAGKMVGVVQQHFVKLGQTRGDLVAIVSGIKEGDVVVSSGVFKLQNNGPVQINNSVQPEAEDAPNPEES